MKKTVVVVPFLSIFLLLSAAMAQSSAENCPSATVDFSAAQSCWIEDTFKIQRQTDTVPRADRQIRDEFWDEMYGASGPLSQSGAHCLGVPPGDFFSLPPEFGDLGQGIWLIGKVENSRGFLSSSQRSIYSEISLRVERVFGHPGPQAKEGEIIQIGRIGGVIVAPWGSTLSCEGVRSDAYDFQSDHTYLLALGYHEEGNFYAAGNYVVHRWDLTDGTVKPGSGLMAMRAKKYHSEIIGLTVPEMIGVMDKKFEDYYQQHAK